MSISTPPCGCWRCPANSAGIPKPASRSPQGSAALVPISSTAARSNRSAPDDDVLTIGVNRAVVLLAEPAAERRGVPKPLRELGEHPDGGVVALFAGRYGPYVSHNGVLASLPKGADPETLTLEQALPLLEARRQQKPRRVRRAARPTATGPQSRKATARKALKPAAEPKPAPPRQPAKTRAAKAGGAAIGNATAKPKRAPKRGAPRKPAPPARSARKPRSRSGTPPA